MGISTVPSFVPVDVATRLTALETANTIQAFMSNAKATLSGGGVFFVDTSYNVKFGSFIVIGPGRSSSLCPSGYFDITMPAVGVAIPRVGGGVATVTVSASGITLSA